MPAAPMLSGIEMDATLRLRSGRTGRVRANFELEARLSRPQSNPVRRVPINIRMNPPQGRQSAPPVPHFERSREAGGHWRGFSIQITEVIDYAAPPVEM